MLKKNSREKIKQRTITNKQTTMKTINVHISQIEVGDTILHDGVPKTVCKSNIKWDSFMGLSLFGDSYHLGYKPVKKIIEF